MNPPAQPSLGFAHRFVPGADPAAPVLLLLHGTGGNEDDLLPLGRLLAPGAALLSPRGNVLENGTTPRFFRRLAEGVFDVPDLIARTAELAGFVGAAAARYQFDAGRVVAVGYSNGANVAASLLLRHPGALAGALLLRAMALPETSLPAIPPRLNGAGVLLLSGRLDPVVPPGDPDRLAAALRNGGAEVTLRWLEDAGHGIVQDDILEARRWLAGRAGFFLQNSSD